MTSPFEPPRQQIEPKDGVLGKSTMVTPPLSSEVSPLEKKKSDTITPMMVQYLSIKKEHPEGFLFYRMGDFYELFFDDAVNAASLLDIALTKRGKHLGSDIPMCGVPVHSHETYLNRLIQKGFKVCVCEQTEDPTETKKRGAKAVVHREVLRVVTPGTLSEDILLDARRNNYLATVAGAGGGLGLAWVDISTGEFLMQGLKAGDLEAALARVAPGELLVSESLLEIEELVETFTEWKDTLCPLPAPRFDSANGSKRLQEFYGVKSMDAFGDFSRSELAAAGALLDYLELTQKGRRPRLAPPKKLAEGAVMEIDSATRRNLELTQTLNGSSGNSLLGIIDRTLSGPGARLLGAHLAAPLTDPGKINIRLNMVQYFSDFDHLRKALRDILKQCPDIERALSRLTLRRGGPRDLAAVCNGLKAACKIRSLLKKTKKNNSINLKIPEGVLSAIFDLGYHDKVIKKLTSFLALELPLYARDGGFIASAYSPKLDELRSLRDKSRRLITQLQVRYVEETGIQALKIKHNNMLGYFIELSVRNAEKISTDQIETFIHRQTMASAIRYSTLELGDLENHISRAGEQALALELKLFEELVEEIMDSVEPIALAAHAQARLDVAQGLATLAGEANYVRPDVDYSRDFFIIGGRHPVVEAALSKNVAQAFIANDCRLVGGDENGTNSLAKDGCLWLLTGPNMAGKSTFLRQNALIAVLAQMGSFVPAEYAKIGIIDRLFSRVGAADDLARGRSTFMVEMVETAAILHQAGSRALVILDEIGRGTATFDGLSIAWAVAEHLHENNRCRALFATHYHELSALSSRLVGLRCQTMRVKEWQEEIIFLHEVGPGSADRSYGIHVGSLAGLPKSVIGRASEVLDTLEKGDKSSAMSCLADDLPLFRNMQETQGFVKKTPSEVELAIATLDVDSITPREALEMIYTLKGKLGDDH
jgi:DNA mismatch repair protein MutS